MGIQLEDGKGSGKLAGVASTNRLQVNSKVAERIYYCSRDMGDAYTVTITDTAPTANDYLLWIQNNSETHFVLHKILTSSANANVIWKLWNTTGQTGTAASAVTPQATNLTSSLAANLTCLGGDITVASLTAHTAQTKLLTTWYNGTSNSTVVLDTHDAIRIGQNQSVAFEYQEGLGATASISVLGFFDEEG